MRNTVLNDGLSSNPALHGWKNGGRLVHLSIFLAFPELAFVSISVGVDGFALTCPLVELVTGPGLRMLPCFCCISYLISIFPVHFK